MSFLAISERAGGYTCLGFNNAFEKGRAVALWLRDRGVSVSIPKTENVGKILGYREYEAAVAAARIHYEETKERCSIELSPQLNGLEGSRIEVIDSYGERRRFYVGRSTGWIPCHLEIARIDSTGGFPVMGTPFREVRVIQTMNR